MMSGLLALLFSMLVVKFIMYIIRINAYYNAGNLYYMYKKRTYELCEEQKKYYQSLLKDFDDLTEQLDCRQISMQEFNNGKAKFLKEIAKMPKSNKLLDK